MESLGIDFSSSGSVMNKDQLEEQRRKRGQCLTCGQKCFQKKLFKLIPITEHGKVLDGRCLKCKPLEAKMGEAIPAVSRPATQQDLERFTRSQSSLSMSGPGVKPMGLAPQRRTRSTNPSSSSVESMRSRTNSPRPRSFVSMNSYCSDDDMDEEPDDGSRESDFAPPRTRREISSGTRSTDGRSVDSGRSQVRAPLTNQTHAPSQNAAIPSNIEGFADFSSQQSEFTTEFQRAMIGSMAASQMARNFRARKAKAAPISERAASMPQENFFENQDEADQEDSFGSLRSQERSDLISQGAGSFKNEDDDFYTRPVHGVLNRGGVMRFERPGMHAENGSGQPLLPFPATNTESSRTMSSMSSMEDDPGMNGRQVSRKPAAQFANMRQAPIVLENDLGTTGSNSRRSVRSNLSSKSGTGTQGSLIKQHDHEKRAMEKIQYAEDDYLAVVEVMKANKQSADIQKEALKNLSNLLLSPDQYADIFSIGALEATVAAMRSHPQNQDLQVFGCRAIWNLSATPENQLKLVSVGALDVILAAMTSFSNDAEIQEKALAALSNLGASERNQGRLIEREVVEKIVEAMNNHSEDSHVQSKACAAITNFASYDSPLKRKIMESGGGGAVVIAMIMHPEDVDLQEKALRALRNICANCDENKVEVAGVGGIDAVISAMQVHRDEPGVQEAGAWTLSNLAVNPDNKAVIGDSGGVDVIIRAMWVHSEHVSVQEWCCRALWTLSVDAQNRQVMLEVGGISAVVNCMQAHADAATVQEKGCGVLSNLSATDEASKIRIVEEEALDAIVMAMVLHSDNGAVQDRACSVLKRLAIEPNLKQMQAANVAELVEQALANFPDRCGDKAKQILSFCRSGT